MIQRKLAGVLFCACALASSAQDLDWLFMAQRSFCSASMKGLGDAGIAVAGDVSAGQFNPALVYSSIRPGVGAVALGYGRDSLWGRHIVPFSIGYSSGKGAIGAAYRYQSGDGGIINNGITFNLSGQLFENADVQGAVDFGINFRYEWMSLDRQWSRTLPIERFMVDTAGKAVFQQAVDSTSFAFHQVMHTRRFITDIGFFQPNFADHFDFGLVLRNLAGYEWEKKRPTRTSTDSAIGDTIIGNDTAARFDRTYSYLDGESATKGWLEGRYRTLVIGIAYRIEVSESFMLCFPVDLELYGLFNRKMKNSFVFRGGASALLKQMFIVRLGYARQPKTILDGLTSFKNANVFTGGAGVYLSPVTFDFYLSQPSFGFTAGYRF